MNRPSLMIGRWQPFHDGHKALVETVLNEGKDVVIACRITDLSETDPYTFAQRRDMIEAALAEWGDRVQVIPIPDIGEVVYGRQVGYGIRELSLDAQTEAISGTQIRAEGNLPVETFGYDH